LKVYENYKQALAKAGFTLLSKCELDGCGGDKHAPI
jgi:nitrogen regulatory protein PII